MHRRKIIQQALLIVTIHIFLFASTAFCEKEFILSGCEYSVIFPDGYTTKRTEAFGIEQLIAEYKGIPYFRAECLSVSDRSIIRGNMKNAMLNLSKIAGFPYAQTSIEETPIGTIGTYMSFKKVEAGDIKLFGKCYLGEQSFFNILVLEESHAFPSNKTIRFLDSVNKIR